MIEIKPQMVKSAEITVPGSKSYTHRILIAAALSNGICTITNALHSEDTLYTLRALKQMGIDIEEVKNCIRVQGRNGVFQPSIDPIFLGNSGTSMRLLTAVATLGQGTYILNGTERMTQRPIQDLLDGLNQVGTCAYSVNENGCPPVKVVGGNINGGPVTLNCKTSSQFLSAMLLIAPLTKKGMVITITEGPVSKPYIDMTVNVMERLGIKIDRTGYHKFHIPPNQIYHAGMYEVEPDASQAGYFWAAAAISGNRVKVCGIRMDSKQGDVRFVEALSAMGCDITIEQDGIAVTGGPLSAIDIDMADMPDMVPTLAVVASFAKGITRIRNVAHLKDKESDRLGSVVHELVKMGINARCSESELIIQGSKPKGAQIDTYDDHRMAMSFAIAGLVIPGVFIKDETCVEKSFPNFWSVFEGLYQT